MRKNYFNRYVRRVRPFHRFGRIGAHKHMRGKRNGEFTLTHNSNSRVQISDPYDEYMQILLESEEQPDASTEEIDPSDSALFERYME